MIVGILTIVFFGVLRRLRRRRARRHRVEILRSLPDAIDLLVASLRAGRSTPESIDLVARHAPAVVRNGFVACVRAHDDGARFTESLDELAKHLGPGVWPVVDVLRDHLRLGVPLVDTAEHLAVEARTSRRRANETNARELPVRLAMPLVLCTLPSFVSIVIAPVVLSAFAQVGLR